LSTASNSALSGQIFLNLEVNDGTNWDTINGQFGFAVVNKAGTLTVGAMSAIYGASNAVNSGTVSYTISSAASGTSLALKIDPSWTVIVPTTVRINYMLFINGSTTVTPQ
jgi:hypothetical protein